MNIPKTLTYALIFIALLSCSKSTEQTVGTEEQLISDFDAFLQKEFLLKLKDPSSYQKSSSTISDTVYLHNELNRQLGVAETLWSGDDIQIRKDSIKNLLNTRPASEIFYINIILEYRAKNSFGALDLDRINFRYYPNYDAFPEKFVKW